MNCGTSLLSVSLADVREDNMVSESLVLTDISTTARGMFSPQGRLFIFLSFIVWGVSALSFAGMVWLLANAGDAFGAMWMNYAILSGMCLTLSLVLPLIIPWSDGVPYRVLAGTAFMAFGLDQLSKWVAVAYLKGNASVRVIENLFSFTYVQNPGAAFGLLKGHTTLFIVMAMVTGVVIFLYFQLTAADEHAVQLALVLILSGAVGNLVDRVFLGYVVDFLAVHHNSWRWPVFNIADMMIDIGVALIILDVIRDLITGAPEDDSQHVLAESAETPTESAESLTEPGNSD